MNCRECHELLHPHVDGELDIRGALEFERHLATCPTCAAERESVRSLKAALRGSSLRYDAPDSLRRTIRRLGRPLNSVPTGRLSWSLWLWRSWAVGATALALVIVLTLPIVSGRDRLLDEAVSSHVRSLMAEHLTDVLSGDQHTVKPWFNGKLDFAPHVKDFAAQGFLLVGGRLDYLGGRGVAVLVYRHNKHVINAYIWPVTGTNSHKISTNRLRGYSVINRESEGFHYLVISDLNQEELTNLADLLVR